MTGTLVKTYKYDAYGNVMQETGPTVPGGITYTGRQYHSRSGLYYYRARWYSPQLGRFLTQDPIGHLGGVNLYAYVGNSPVSLFDPLGLSYALFDTDMNTLTVFGSDGSLLGSYAAGNNSVKPRGNPYVVESKGPAPAGTFPVQPPVDTQGSLSYGPYFWPIGAVGPSGERLDIARKRGIGLHAGRSGPQSRTEGCIRIGNEDSVRLFEATANDPLDQITILPKGLSTQNTLLLMFPFGL